MSLTEFARLAGWSPELIESTTPRFDECGTMERLVKENGGLFIGRLSELYMSQPDLVSQVSFTTIQALRDDHSRVAELAGLLAELSKISTAPLSFKLEEYHKVLLEVFPSDDSHESKGRKDRVERALHTGFGGEFTFRPGGDYVQEFWQTIEQSFGMWSDRSLSPYTSLVAPMGTGKTRTLEEFAQRVLCYVSYFNATTKKSFTSPNRSLMADYMERVETREEMTVFWESYIASILEQVALCRQMGISPKGFFDIQTMESFEEIQPSIAQNVWRLYEQAKSELVKETAALNPSNDTERVFGQRIRSDSIGHGQTTLSFVRRTHVDRLLPDHREAMRMVFSEAIKGLPNHLSWPEQPNAELEYGKLQCVICLDDPAQLFETRPNETVDNSKFGAWRRALRHRATPEDGKTKTLQFFGVVTDTTSRVSHLSPPRAQDQILAASPLLEDLVPPLWQIDSFDVLADRTLYALDRLPVRSDHLSDDYHRKSFSFGRPLLGALLKHGSISVDDVKKLFFRKVPGLNRSFDNDPHHIRALALMNYRCEFFVNLQSLAEQLCSSYLRFVADISDDRTLVRTLQPSEPFLAWLAADQMRSSEVRLSVVKAFLHHTQRGFINVGDIREMVGSMILLFAFDRAHGQGLPRPMAVSDFFKSLFPEHVYRDMKKKMHEKKCKNSQSLEWVPLLLSFYKNGKRGPMCDS